MVEAGRVVAAASGVDSVVAIGGGSSLDCAKGINFVLTNGGTMRDYRGHGKADAADAAVIGVPTTAGTGSEAQSYAIISDPGDAREDGLRRPEGGVSDRDSRSGVSPSRSRASLTAVTGFDAISHAVESYVTTKRTPVSRSASRARPGGCSSATFERVLDRAGRPRRSRRDAARRALGGRRDRAVDARRHSRLRESADRALRHDPRRRDRRHAAARRALERAKSSAIGTPSS